MHYFSNKCYGEVIRKHRRSLVKEVPGKRPAKDPWFPAGLWTFPITAISLAWSIWTRKKSKSLIDPSRRKLTVSTKVIPRSTTAFSRCSRQVLRYYELHVRMKFLILLARFPFKFLYMFTLRCFLVAFRCYKIKVWRRANIIAFCQRFPMFDAWSKLCYSFWKIFIAVICERLVC